MTGQPLDAAPRQQLSLLDSTCIIVGIIIGASIYESSPFIAQNASAAAVNMVGQWREFNQQAPLSLSGQATVSQLAIIGVWLLGGVLALIGALCYAELATAWPDAGGSYFFITRAFGKTLGFAFAWCEFWIIRPGNVGAIAFVFAVYAMKLVAPDVPPDPAAANPAVPALLAAGAITLLTITNLLGLQIGKWTQNILTLLKVAGLAVIILVALTLTPPESVATAQPTGDGSLGTALIMVMFAYGGWSDMSYVAAEVKNPAKNITRALLLGTLAVTVIYLLINIAFARGLGLAGFFSSQGVASDVLRARFGPWGARAISLLICVSCLGAINGMTFTGARVCYALGVKDPLFAWLGKWNEQRGVPIRATVVQAVVTIALVIGFGLREGGFKSLVIFTGPFFWGFFVLVGLALIVLRDREPDRPRLFRLPLFPILPAIFCLSSGYMMLSSITYVSEHLAWEAGWAVLVLISGFAVAWVRSR
ncbi:MAG: amino acid permease [Pirellulaceae bacterium]|nr:amino acid permease [Pirellulaceae bacterium]